MADEVREMRTYVREHWKIALVLAGLPLAAAAVFAVYGCVYPAALTAADWMAFVGAVLAYGATTSLGAVALYQSERANRLSEQVYQLSRREYAAVFAVESAQELSIARCGLKTSAARITFCRVDVPPPQCQGYLLRLKNYGSCPITRVEVSTTYPVGRKRTRETLEKEMDILIPPQTVLELLVCNTPAFSADGGGVQFAICCRNMFGDSSRIQVRLEQTVGQDGEQALRCVCRQL